jgi:hypothetical protein
VQRAAVEKAATEMGAPEVPQRDGIQSGFHREGISLHHLPLVALRRAVARAGSSSDSASGRTRCVLSVHDGRARLGASDRHYRAERATQVPEIHGRQNAEANTVGRCRSFPRTSR